MVIQKNTWVAMPLKGLAMTKAVKPFHPQTVYAMGKAVFCGHNTSLYGVRPDPKNKKRPPRLLAQHDSPFALKPRDFWAHLVTGFQTGENSSTVTKRFVTSTR